jgi:site-specific DNA recombinase
MSDKKLKAVVYSRVSTDKDAQKTSIENQTFFYTDYCEKMGYTLGKMYTDEGFTGVNNHRKSFLEMLYDAGLDYKYMQKKDIYFYESDREPLFNMIIVKDVSRFSRNTTTKDIVNKLVSKKVTVLFENNGLSTDQHDWQTRFDILISFAEAESRQKSEKMKFAIEAKRNRNEFHFSRVPYGYEYNKETNSYIIKEEEAEIIRKIFDMYVNENKGFRLIAQWLTDNGVRNQRAKNNVSKWHESTVGRMIENPVYIGHVQVNRFNNQLGSTRKKTNDAKIIKNVTPPIIEEEIFNDAMETRKNRRIKTSDNSLKGRKLTDDIFYRKIKCAKCDRHFTRVSAVKYDKEGNKRLDTNYFCYNRRKYGTCDMRGVSYNVLEREIIRIANNDIVKKMNIQIESERQSKDILIKRLDDKLAIQKEAVENLQSAVKEIDKKLSDAGRNLINNSNVSESVKEVIYEEIEKLKEEKRLLVDGMGEYDTISIEKEKSMIHDRLIEIENFYEKKKFNFEDMIDLFRYVEVKDGKHLDFFFTMPSLFTYRVWGQGKGVNNKDYRRFVHFEVKY